MQRGGGGGPTDPKERRNCYKFPDSLHHSPLPHFALVGIVTKELCDREIFGKCPEGRLAADATQQEDARNTVPSPQKYEMFRIDWCTKVDLLSTFWGVNLLQRFYNRHCRPLGCTAAAICCPGRQGELSENILQNLRNKFPPQTADESNQVNFSLLL